MSIARRWLSLAVVLVASCESKISTETNQDRLNQIQTIADCFPGLYRKVEGLLIVAGSWRMNTSSSVPDPSGLTHSQGSGGEIVASYVFNGCTLAMTIRFYSPAGAEQNLDLSSVSSLADKIDLAATTLRTGFPTGRRFMVGAWTLNGTKSGDAVTGSGALTGIIGGSTNGNELEELRTTQATPAGGPPLVASSTISEGDCTITFSTNSLVTDGSPQQQYPVGTVTMDLVGPPSAPTAIGLTGTFDDTAIVRIAIDGAPGRFEFNVDTGDLNQVP